jgi:hypothetical protein
MSPTVFLGAMLVVIGSLIGLILLKVTRDVRILHRRGLPVTGRVVSVRPTLDHMTTTVEYLDQNGVEHTTSWGFEIDTESVELLVDPDKPSRVTLRAGDPTSPSGRITEIVIYVVIAACVIGVIAGVLLIVGVLG